MSNVDQVPIVKAPTQKLAYAAVRLVQDNSVQVHHGLFDTPEGAAQRCHEDALERTHNRFGCAFDENGRSYKWDTRTKTHKSWPAGSGYAIEQVLVEEEE